MSPENGSNNSNNQPPTITRRKKNKKSSTSQTITNSPNDINLMQSYNNYLTDQYSNYQTFNSNSMIQTAESMSLPSTTNNNYNDPFKLVLNYGGNVNPLRFPSMMTTATTTMGSSASQQQQQQQQQPQDYMQMNDYVSLPLVNLNQRLSELEDLSDEDLRRRFSDPCLLLNGVVGIGGGGSGGGGVGTPTTNGCCFSTTDSNEKLNEENTLIKYLTQKVNYLNENQQKLSRELVEMRIEMNMLKQQQQMLCLNGATCHNTSREYEPGMLSDIIREVRDAARVREDALLARVKHMIEEKELVLVSKA